MNKNEPIRARRRRIREKMIKRTLLILKRNNWFIKSTEDEIHKQAKKYADNFKKCSCYMCCNPRRSFLNSAENRMTMKERREWLNFIDQENLLTKPTNKRSGKIHG